MNKTLVTIDTGDISGQAESMGVTLSESEVQEIFDDIDQQDWNCESSTFNSFIEEKIRQYDNERKAEIDES